MAGNLTAMIAAAFSGGAAPPVTTDPYFDYTTLLLPGNGTNGAQNNTFLDGSTNNFTITRNGNTTQGTFSPFSQTGWALLNTTNPSQGISSSTSSDFSFGTGDWSVECWIYRTGNGGSPTFLESFIDMRDADVTNNGISIGTRSDGTIYAYDSGLTTASGVFTSNSWNHIVYSRQSSAIRIFVNGVLRAYSSSYTSNYTNINCRIGTNFVSGYGFIGYISNVRIIKGSVPTSYQTSATSLGTSVFTPSTSPLTTTSAGATASAVSLLTCQSNRFVDNSTANPKTITTINAPSVVAFSPFNPSASWSAATYGGSGYFDGSGDYLTVPNNTPVQLGTGDFEIDAWVYVSSIAATVLIDARSSGTASSYTLGYNSSGFPYIYDGSTSYTGSSGITAGQWNYIVWTRSSGTLRIFVNGTSVYSASNSSSLTGAGTNLTICSIVSAGGQSLTGYLSDLRIVKGAGITTSTVPTSPLTTTVSSGTVGLLLNFTNAGIYDATSKNDLETVGNAQISTAISAKWGSGSMYFDGTGDYLNTLSTWAISGSEAYTLEAWIYPTTVSGDLCIYETRSSSGTGFVLFINSTGKLQVYDSTGLLQTASTTTLTANTWTYIAMVRSAGSSTNTFYVNGTSAGTFTLASFATATNARIGARNDGVAAYNGYMQDFRITKGYARTITASPTAAFPTL